MQWYGSYNKDLNTKPFIKNSRTRITLKARTLALDLRPKTSYEHYTTSVHFPQDCKYTCLKNKFRPDIFMVHLAYSVYVVSFFFSIKQVKFLHSSLARSIFLYFPKPNNYFKLY